MKPNPLVNHDVRTLGSFDGHLDHPYNHISAKLLKPRDSEAASSLTYCHTLVCYTSPILSNLLIESMVLLHRRHVPEIAVELLLMLSSGPGECGEREGDGVMVGW